MRAPSAPSLGWCDVASPSWFVSCFLFFELRGHSNPICKARPTRGRADLMAFTIYPSPSSLRRHHKTAAQTIAHYFQVVLSPTTLDKFYDRGTQTKSISHFTILVRVRKEGTTMIQGPLWSNRATPAWIDRCVRTQCSEWQSATAASAAVGLACHASRLLGSLRPEVRGVSGTRLQHRQQQRKSFTTTYGIGVPGTRQPATRANIVHNN